MGIVLEEETTFLVAVRDHAEFGCEIFDGFDGSGYVVEAKERGCGRGYVADASPDQFSDHKLD